MLYVAACKRHWFLSKNTDARVHWVCLWCELGGRGALGLIRDSWKGWIIEERGPAPIRGPSAQLLRASTPTLQQLLRRVQLTGSICYWSVMNTVRAVQKWITATLLKPYNSNDCAIHSVGMAIIMTSLIIMMIRMQMVAAELMMMMIMKVMCVSYDDVAGRGKKHGYKNPHLLCMQGGNSHLHICAGLEEEENLTYL